MSSKRRPLHLAVLTVPRVPSYFEETLAGIQRQMERSDIAAKLRVMVGTRDTGYASDHAGEQEISVHYLKDAEFDLIQPWSVHRRLAYNLWNTLVRGAPEGEGLCVFEDDVVLADHFLDKLCDAILEVESRELPKFVLTAYSHFDFASDPARQRGKFYCSCDATTFYGTCGFYVSGSLRSFLASYVRQEAADCPNLPADLAVGQCCENLWQQGEGGMYQTVSSIVQHIGVVSGGTSGRFSCSPTFGRPWPI